MAVTSALLVNGVNCKIWSVIATADADRDAAIDFTTLLGTDFAPDSADYSVLLQAGGNTDAIADSAALSAWAVSRLPTADQVQVRKTAAVGSLNAAIQLRVIVFRRLSPSWT